MAGFKAERPLPPKRSTWVAPEVRRLEAGSAEHFASGADDGVDFS